MENKTTKQLLKEIDVQDHLSGIREQVSRDLDEIDDLNEYINPQHK